MVSKVMEGLNKVASPLTSEGAECVAQWTRTAKMDEDQRTSCVSKVSRCLQLGHSVSETSEYGVITASQITIFLSSISNDKYQLTFILGLILSLLTFESSGGKKGNPMPTFLWDCFTQETAGRGVESDFKNGEPDTGIDSNLVVSMA